MCRKIARSAGTHDAERPAEMIAGGRAWGRGAAALIAPAFFVAACSQTSGRPVPATALVRLEGLAFVPSSVRVSRPGTVTWTDNEPVEHTITAGTPSDPNRGLFDAVLLQNEEFSFMFKEPGTIAFFCTRHPANMQGTVTVV